MNGTPEQQAFAAFLRYRAELTNRLREVRTELQQGRGQDEHEDARRQQLERHRLVLLGERERVDAELTILRERRA